VGAAGGRAGAEPGGPQHPQRGAVPGGVRPVGAFAEGDAERAALLVGAAEGLRQRVGVGVWPPMRRRLEAELVVQVRQALGADRFDRMFAAGARLNGQEAVAAVRDQRADTRAS
jgi:hypothetical protein